MFSQIAQSPTTARGFTAVSGNSKRAFFAELAVCQGPLRSFQGCRPRLVLVPEGKKKENKKQGTPPSPLLANN